MNTDLPPADSPVVHAPRGSLFRWAGVRLIVGLLIVIGMTIAVQIAFNVASNIPAVRRVLYGDWHLFGLITALASGAGYVLYVRWIERRLVREFSPRGALAEAARGALLGCGMFAATIGVLAALGCYGIEGPVAWTALWPAVMIAATAAVTEEILFRGLIFRITEEGLGTSWALAISAIIFGAIHFANPHSGVVPAVALMLEAGVFLAAAFLWTRRLWFVIGAHFAWNFTQSGIFGLATSGRESGGLWRGTLTGPGWLSGGEFGAETSAVAIVVCLAVAVYLLARVRGRGGWRRRNPARAALPAESTATIVPD